LCWKLSHGINLGYIGFYTNEKEMQKFYKDPGRKEIIKPLEEKLSCAY